MRAQQHAVVEVKGVVHRPRRVVLGDVQRFEIVKIVLDLGTLGDVETEFAEHRIDAVHRERYRVQAAGRLAPPRQSDIHRFASQLSGDRGIRQRRLARFDLFLHPLLGAVDRLAGRGPLLGRQLAEVFQ